jgi:hypothetical protein
MALWERYSWWREATVKRDIAASEARKVPLRPSRASWAWHLDVPEPVNVYIEDLLFSHTVEFPQAAFFPELEW